MPTASCHRAGVFIASLSVQDTSSDVPGFEVDFESSDGVSPSGKTHTDSGVSARNKNAGSKATIQTATPRICQVTCHPYIPISIDAIKGNPVIPIEWQNESIPFARPLLFINQRETTTEDPIWTGLLNITLPIP